MTVKDITSHGFESHSRRPSECRICKMPAGQHATCTDAYQGLWRSLRNPLVTARIESYGTRTLGVLMAIATLGGKVDSWDRGNRGWHRTAVAILDKDGLMVQVNPGESPARYELTETGVQACRWHGIAILDAPETVEVTPVTSTTAESLALLDAITDATPDPVPAVVAGDTVYRDRDGAQGIVLDVIADVITVEYGNGCVREGTVLEFLAIGFEIISAAEVAEGQALADGPWRAMETAIWGSTDTVRTHPRSFRKIKNTRSSRARRGGAR